MNFNERNSDWKIVCLMKLNDMIAMDSNAATDTVTVTAKFTLTEHCSQGMCSASMDHDNRKMQM